MFRSALFLCVFAAPSFGADPAEFFESKVRPILVEHCAKCHGGDTAKGPKGGLRLDSRAAILKGGDSGPAVVPGDPAKSRLIDAVKYGNVDLLMPPKGKLPDAAIRDLETWVKAGAVWPGDVKKAEEKAGFDLAKRKAGHWCWAPLVDPKPPTIADAAWNKSDIDRFIRAKLDAAGVTPNSPADATTLLRRLSFDLTGLPPSIDDVNAILNGKKTYEAFVERYLASPHFGERWARHWLDVVRYADTRGHEFDHPIPNAWRYRDYVIRAINADLPYREFVTEHIAGDRLAKPRLHPSDGSNESIQGTGFWLLGEEVHSPVDIRQDQADRFDNRIDVFGKAFLGLTVACARCHDHKFDAISTKDYYSLFALLEASSSRQVRIDDQKEIDVLVEASWARYKRTPFFCPVVPGYGESVGVEKPIVNYAKSSEHFFPDGIAYGMHPIFWGENGVVKNSGDGKQQNDRGRLAAVYDRQFDERMNATPKEREPGDLGKYNRAGRTIRTPPFQIVTGKIYVLMYGGAVSYAAVGHHTMIAGPLHGKLIREFSNSRNWRWELHDLSEYKGLTTHLELSPLPHSDFALAAVVQTETKPELPENLRSIPVKAPVEDTRFGRKSKDPPSPRPVTEPCLALALWEGPPITDRVFVRGSPRNLGEVVLPRFLEALIGTKRLEDGRLGLAKQVTDPTITPHTYRVFANRVWHHLFGRGIVPSVDNFGVLGEAPSHQELLDHLAGVVRDRTPKELIRRIVLSNAYRMSSRETPESETKDPGNRLFHRQTLRRLDSEAIRDSMLAVSGRLDPKPFGPPVPVYVSPFQDGRGKPATGPLDGDGRRSIYIRVQRNFLSPFQLAFDAPIPSSTVGKRQVSNVPAQALILLNDEFVHQQAKKWADATKSITKPEERIANLYLKALARPATADEVTTCRQFLGDEPDYAALAHALFNVKEFTYLP